MSSWIDNAFFYHLYPLGVTGAPWTNPGGPSTPRIRQLIEWIAPAQAIGANALLLGPLWESATHGYDTHDYCQLDRRLGTNADLKATLAEWKDQGFRIVFDGVFNHCGRGFPPFADLQAQGEASPYRDWFAGVDFTRRSPRGDNFGYEGWNGHYSLVKFNLGNPAVRKHLFDAVDTWITEYDLDGLRLDAADVIDPVFLRELSAHCRALKSDFWLMGEVIHGDYSAWAPGAGLAAVTNYELFKGLWSSHNDRNYFEAAWTLNRQFGPDGLYRGQRYYTFGDNHDVNRLASTLHNPRHLYPHAILAATAPGVPSVYYGSEAGMEGKKSAHSDEPLRPALQPDDLDQLPHQPLRFLWKQLSALRGQEAALRTGTYEQALVASQQFAYWRHPETAGRSVLVAVNSDETSRSIEVSVPHDGLWTDLLNPGDSLQAHNGRLSMSLWPCWGRILVRNQ